jgi:hypothetical protein
MNYLKIGNNLQINNKTAAKLYRWALRDEVMSPPFLRLKSFSNFQEYTYFLKYKDATSVFEKLKNDPRVIYQCVCSGAFDLVVIASERIDVSMEPGFEYIVLSGPRGDYIFNKVEKKSMNVYLDEFQSFLRSGDFVTSEIVPPVKDELLWDDLDWALFRLLKNDARMKYVNIIQCLGLSKSVFYDHLNTVMENCIAWTPFYPKSYSKYNGYFILFRTNHENQLIEKLKELPVLCPIIKVKSWIYAYTMIEKKLAQVDFINLLRVMQSSGFIEEYRYSVPIFHWNRTWTTQESRRHSPRSRRTD